MPQEEIAKIENEVQKEAESANEAAKKYDKLEAKEEGMQSQGEEEGQLK